MICLLSWGHIVPTQRHEVGQGQPNQEQKYNQMTSGGPSSKVIMVAVTLP